MSIFALFLWYGFAQKVPLSGGKLPPPKSSLSWSQLPKLQKSWTKLPCELETWFVDKVSRIRDNCIEKLALLNQVNMSLQQIIPLVKDTTIKSNLQVKQKAVVAMIKNYVTLKTALEKNPKSTCWQKTPVWKTYNEQTKVLVDEIRAQIRLLKK